MGSSKKIFSGVAWSVITNIVNALYGFLLIPILINYFGKAEYGLIGLAQSVNAYMRLMDLGLTSTNVRFFSNWLAGGDEEKVRKLFSSCTSFYGIVGLINAVFLLVVYFFSGSIFNVSPEQDVILKNLLLILAVAAIVNWVTSCYNQIIQATENVAWVQKRLLITKLLMVLAIIVTVIFKLNVTVYVALTVLCNWMVLPWVVKKIRILTPFISFKPKFDRTVFKEILPYTLNIFSYTIFSFSYNQLQPVFLGIQGTVESVADYKIVMGIIGLVHSVSSIFMNTLLPSSSKVIATNDKDAYYRIAYQGTKYIMLFLGFCVFGVMTIGKDLLILYMGEDYAVLTPWLYILLFMLLTGHIMGISSLILGGSDIRPLSRMTAISSTLALAAAWFTIPILGLGGCVVAVIVYNLGNQTFYYFYYWPRIMKIDSWIIMKTIVLPVTSFGLLVWFALLKLPHFASHWANLFVFGAVFTIVYIVFVWIYTNQADKKFFLELIVKKNK